MHFAAVEEIQQAHHLRHLGTRSTRRGGPTKHPGRVQRPIRSAVERIRLVVVPDHRAEASGSSLPPADGSTQIGAELAREHDRLHELRSTVSGLVASYQLLHEHGDELPAAARTRLEQLHGAELGRLERLLGDQAAGPGEWVDLGPVVDDLVQTLHLRGHEVTWTGTTVRAWGCRDDVAQVLHVLLENAVRHAFGNDIGVTVSLQDERVEVRVRDHGPGIAPEVRQELFRRGVRRNGSPGDGIGLSIAHRLADQMGATLRLDPDDPGAPGSTFVLSLPVAPACGWRTDGPTGPF